MKPRTCYLFVYDTFADWEPALIVALLKKYSDFEVRTFSCDGKSVQSMGGVRVLPDDSIQSIDIKKAELLIIPGGDLLELEGIPAIEPVIKAFRIAGKTIAGICAGTIPLAKCALLDDVKHTSNEVQYLADAVPEYKGALNYVNEPSVADDNIITANGAAMIDFAFTIIKNFQIFKQEETDFYYKLYKNAGIISYHVESES